MSFNTRISKFFSYLIDLGYNEIFYSNNIVRYNNNIIIIEVLYNEYCYEIEANFLSSNVSEKVSLEDILLYLGIQARGTYQLQDREKLDLGLEYMSNTIKKVLDIIDDKNSETVQKAFLFAEDNRQNKLLNLNRKSDFDRAETYWKNKSYNEVKKIYSKYINDLPKLYKKRLDYICNKMHKESDF